MRASPPRVHAPSLLAASGPDRSTGRGLRALRVRVAAAAVAVVLSGTACGGPGERPVAEKDARVKVGFLFIGSRDDLGYNQAAWEGSDAVAEAFPDIEVLREERVPETAAAERAMERMIDEGVSILFPTSFGYLESAVAVARRHPDVVVVHQGGVEPVPRLANLGTYFGAVYEPVFQAGIAAGAATRTGKLGFVAAFPIPATFNNVNAFTLGARSVNPSVTTSVTFTGSWCNPVSQVKAARLLLRGGADVLAQHQDCTRSVLEEAERAGAYSVGYHYDGSEVAARGWLIGSVWAWGDLYVDIVRTVEAGAFAKSRYGGDFRGGLRTGDNPFVLTEPGLAVGDAARALIAEADRVFRDGGSPFTGPVDDRDGVARGAPGLVPSTAEVDRMDWFVEGVTGDIPRR